MVHWIYILECNDNFIYVGETTTLYKRLTQHISGRGGCNTHAHIPKKLLGLYKLNDNQSYYQYFSAKKNNIDTTDIINNWGSWGDNLFIENRFTERLFYERRNNQEYGSGKEWYRVRGGKYTRSDIDFAFYHAKSWSEKPNRIVGGYRSPPPTWKMDEKEIVDRPLCKCGMPAEVKLSKDKSKVYFVCALYNVWDNFFNSIEVNDKCDFWMKDEK